MQRVRRGVAAVSQGWTVLWSNGQLLMLMVAALLLTFGAVGAMVALAARTGTHSIAEYGAAVVAALALLAGVWVYTASFAAVAQVMESGQLALRRAFAATFGRLHAVLVWGFVTTTVHALLAGPGPAPATFSAAFHPGGRGLLALLWDAAALLVLPALILDTESRGRIHRSFGVSSRGFVESLVVMAAFALAGLALWFVIAVSPFAIGFAALAAWILSIVVLAWSVCARVAAYRLVLEADDTRVAAAGIPA
jgi:hypothetical protein